MHAGKWFCLICALFTLTGCVQSQKDVETYVQQVKQTAKGKIEPIPAARKIASVNYTSESMRSPFSLVGGSYTGEQELISGPGGQIIKQQPRPDLDRPREYLEQFPLASLSMVGILSKPGVSWGLIKDGNGMIHAVKVGDYLGLNSGQIIAIMPDQIKLNETVPNGSGGWMQSRAALALIPAPAEQAAEAPQTPQKAQTITAPKTNQQQAPQIPASQVQQRGSGGRAGGGGGAKSGGGGVSSGGSGVGSQQW